jgi:hypothetical protein
MAHGKRTTRQPIPNPDDPSGESLLLPLTQGKFAIIDRDMAETLARWNWHAKWSGFGWYAAHRVGPRGNSKIVGMHQVVLGTTDAPEVDHVNRNGLDNRRHNLRDATRMQNAWNTERTRSQSGFRGVSWQAHAKMWRAEITMNRKRVYLGYFRSPEAAAHAFDDAARRLRGEFARCNFPPKD